MNMPFKEQDVTDISIRIINILSKENRKKNGIKLNILQLISILKGGYTDTQNPDGSRRLEIWGALSYWHIDKIDSLVKSLLFMGFYFERAE